LFTFSYFQEATIFYFDKRTAEKLHKVKRKEVAVDVLKRGFYQLKKFQHYCQVLQIYHNLEETNDNLAFATESVFGSLANIFGYLQDRLRQDIPSSLREYSFLEFEVKYGLLQVSLSHIFCLTRSIHIQLLLTFMLICAIQIVNFLSVSGFQSFAKHFNLSNTGQSINSKSHDIKHQLTISMCF